MDLKITNHLKSLGCKSNISIALAYQVYVELFEVKLMYNVDFAYSKDLDLIYLTAKPTKKANTQIFIPQSTSQTINMKIISEYQNKLCDKDKEQTVTIACVESDSTVVLYTFTKGLIDVQDPEYLTRHRTREERKNFLENEIRKNKFSILLEAHNQSVIED